MVWTQSSGASLHKEAGTPSHICVMLIVSVSYGKNDILIKNLILVDIDNYRDKRQNMIYSKFSTVESFLLLFITNIQKRKKKIKAKKQRKRNEGYNFFAVFSLIQFY